MEVTAGEVDRLAALHADLVAEAKAVGLDALFDLHLRLRSIPHIEGRSLSRYTNPGFWEEWKKKIDKGDHQRSGRKHGTRGMDRKDNKSTRREVQDTYRPRRVRSLPRIGYPATLVRRESISPGPHLYLEAEPSISKARGSVAMATMTPHSSGFIPSDTSQSSLADIPAKRVIGGSFLKSARFSTNSSTSPLSKNDPGNVSRSCFTVLANTSSSMMKFSATHRFPTSNKAMVGEVGPGSYQIRRLFDGANPREERFLEIIAEIREKEKKDNLW